MFGNKSKDAPKAPQMAQKDGDQGHDDENVPLTQEQFKKGEYLVHVLVEQTRGLSNPTEVDRTIDPLIQVQCFQQTRYTKLKSGAGTGSTLWNEHLHFTKKFEDGRALNGEQIMFTVLNHKYFGANAVVGIYEIDFSTIYMLDRHVLMHKWLGLTNPQKDFNKLTGFLKVSVNIVGEGDNQVALVMDNEMPTEASGDQQTLFGDGDLLLPPHIQTESQLLKITLARGEGLMKMDKFGTIDPYLVFQCGTSSIRTETIDSNQNPVWEQILSMPVMAPCVSDSIMLKLYDYDRGRNDEIVGSQQFLIDDIKQGVYRNPFWINFYGANIGADGDQRKFICSHPDLGTQYAGRLLLKLEMNDQENPVQKIEGISDKGIIAQLRESTTTQWDCLCDVFYVMNCPVEDGKYSIKVRWAEAESQTQTNRANNGLCEFYTTQLLKNITFPYRSSRELPDVFVYLMDGDAPICFKRFKANDIFISNQAPLGLEFVKPLIPDHSIKKTDLDKSGILKFRIGIQMSGTPIPPRQLNRPRVGNQRLFINLFQAQGLIPTDMDGLADPICQIIFYDQKAESRLVNDSTSPIWNQQIPLTVPQFASDAMPPIILRFFDQDRVSRDFMGHCIIDFGESLKSGLLKTNTIALPTPQWIPITMLGDKAGQVLVSFNYFDADPRQQFTSEISPKVAKHFVRIRALGLRSLKSFGLLPVTKAFVKFNLKSIMRPDDKQSRNEIMTQPKDAGSNPNIQTIIAFDIMLPEDSCYMPTMQCSVHDYVLKGLVQPLIGTFQIDLHYFQKNTIARIQTFLDQAQKLIMDLGFQGDDAIHLDRDYGIADEKQPAQQKSVPAEPSSPRVGEAKTPVIKKLDRQEKHSPDDWQQMIDVMKQYGILTNDLLRSENIIKYVQYDRNPDDGTWSEIEHYPEDYFVGLGFDTQQQKSDLMILRQQMLAEKTEAPQLKLNSTAQRRLNREIASQSKQAAIDKVQKENAAKGVAHLTQQQQQKQEEKKQGENKDIEVLIPVKEGSQIELSEKSGKHYRLCLPFPLEQSLFMTQHTFDQLDLHKGIQKQSTGSALGDIVFGFGERYQKVGAFKGWVDIIAEGKLKEFKQNPSAKLVPGVLDFKPGKTQTNDWDKELITKTPVIVRVYILDAFNLPTKDATSECDPYISVKLGTQTLDNKHEYKEDTCNPQFFKMFHFSTQLPGACDLVISLYDYDMLKPNELIGETTIDIEDRYFQKRWRQLRQVPIETRQLYHPSSSLSQGVVRLFVEIVSSKIQTIVRNPWFIAPRPSMMFELRVVVWDIFDVPSKDAEDTSDLYVVGYTDEDKKQKTDTHYRAQNGKGSFNWRMTFPLQLPAPEVLISFQIFDKDIFTPDDFISDCTFDLSALASRAFENEINLKQLGSKPPETDGILGGTQFLLTRKSKKDGTLFEKIELVTENAEKPGYNFKPSGKIVVSLEIMPKSMAQQNPVGLGRSEPNHSPFCPAPTGRLEWSWNPFVILRQMLGPRARLMLCWMLLCVLISYLIIMWIPVISGNVVGNIIVGK